MHTAEYFIEHLDLQPHVEGGYYRASYLSNDTFDEKRALWTSIYFLLKTGEVSHFHRLTADEMWYFHAGESLTIYIIAPDGQLKTAQLGLNIEVGEQPQILVPKGHIFGSAMNQNGFSLVGCMVSPGFTFDDFELFDKKTLLNQYPQHEEVILRLSKSSNNN